MSSDRRFLAGPLAALLLAAGIVGLGLMVPGYDPVRQTVSEIGEVGSPMQGPFTALLCAVALCLVVFAWVLRDVAVAARRSAVAAYIVGVTAISAAGVGVFSYPHPLHNLFGVSELIGYQAPLVLALSWRGDPSTRRIVRFSAIMAALVWVMIILNLVTFARHSAIWPYVRPLYGLIQRGLFAAWFAWCAGVGVMMARQRPVFADVG